MDFEKATYRKKFQALRENLSIKERQACSESIFDAIQGLECFKHADTVFAYMSMKSEVLTSSFIESAISKRKQLAVPKIHLDEHGTRFMQFHAIQSLADLKPGFYGIMEPETGCIIQPKPGDLMVVPGLAFTEDGHRLGYGGGFYDSYLRRYGDICFHRVGVAFEIQLTQFIPHEAFDETVDMIVTEKQILDTRSGFELN